MGTHNHRLRLGETVYLEVIAVDPAGPAPRRPRWFGLDHPDTVQRHWETGGRLRGWVANTSNMDHLLRDFGEVFGERRDLPEENPEFSFAIPRDGRIPYDGALPSIIDHRGDTRFITSIPDLGARLLRLDLSCPEPQKISDLYLRLRIAGAPAVGFGPTVRYRALIETPNGSRELW